MSLKNELNQEQLEKVTGGVRIGKERIVQCDSCKKNFNPDTAIQGKPVEKNDGKGGSTLRPTFFCPHCGKESTYTVIQVRPEDLDINITTMQC